MRHPPLAGSTHCRVQRSAPGNRGALSSCGTVFGLDLDADGAQEIIGQHAARADNDGIVLYFQLLALQYQDNLLGTNLLDLRIEQHLEPGAATRGLDALAIA